ncbi:unnamed protein product [Protopolystoma xenopodis]|uniref:Uncharacterized protein n=1 Tax=Protopolystoma xenopodis TaxID=117903 RepID=A0A3S5FDD5_9PLAT|nr:unnamed protein product [Protopolystoma xenopodis]
MCKCEPDGCTTPVGSFRPLAVCSQLVDTLTETFLVLLATIEKVTQLAGILFGRETLLMSLRQSLRQALFLLHVSLTVAMQAFRRGEEAFRRTDLNWSTKKGEK